MQGTSSHSYHKDNIWSSFSQNRSTGPDMGKPGITKSFGGDKAEVGFTVLWPNDCLSSGCWEKHLIEGLMGYFTNYLLVNEGLSLNDSKCSVNLVSARVLILVLNSW